MPCRLYQGINAFATSDAAVGTATTIGNFDGCHRGHQKLIAAAVAHARQAGLTSLALTFEPPPAVLFGRGTVPERLFTPAMKCQAFAELQLENIVMEPFDERLRDTPPLFFYEDFLVRALRLQSLAVGPNFRFGKDRQGCVDFLRARMGTDGLQLEVCPPEFFGELPVSSSRIRAALNAGYTMTAAAMLGRPYALCGTIVKGQQLGRTIGMPTLNLETAG